MINSFDLGWHLTSVDGQLDNLQQPCLIQQSLKGSKTDQAWQGIRLFVGRTNNELCPVATMLSFLAVRGFDHGPLFWTSDGQILTRSMLVHLVGLLKSDLAAVGIDPTHYSGHSFQIGVATTAAANAIPQCRHWEDGPVIPICDTFECRIRLWQNCQ